MMLTRMTDEDWAIALKVFAASRSRRGDKGRDDRRFLQALNYFAVHNITWRALPAEYGNRNSIWKRFWRLSRAGVFEAFEALARLSRTAHLAQMFDATIGRTSRQQGPKEAERSGSGPLAWRVLDQDPSQDRL
jgi:transposase